MTAPAIIKFKRCPASVTKLKNPTVIGRHSGVFVTRSGQAKGIPGAHEGEHQDHHQGRLRKGQDDLDQEAHVPGTVDLGCIVKLIGDLRKELPAAEKMEKTLPMKGIVSAGQLLIHGIGLIRPSQVTVRKLGMIRTMAGIIIVLSMTPKMRSRPGNSIRAKAYAARTLTVSCPARVIKVIWTLLIMYSANCASFHAST